MKNYILVKAQNEKIGKEALENLNQAKPSRKQHNLNKLCDAGRFKGCGKPTSANFLILSFNEYILQRKQHFQLLELMVAIFILMVCIAPTMRILTSIYQTQQAIIRDNQRDHLAHLIHAKFTEQLYKRKIALEELMDDKSIVLADPELDQLLYRTGCECNGTFTIEQSSKKQEKPYQHLCRLMLKIKDKFQETDYDYYIYISRKEDAKGAAA
jgi:hypothetical protein